MPIILAMSKANEERIAKHNIERQGYSAYVPMLATYRWVREAGGKRRVITTRPLFPRYVFVDTPGAWYFLKSTFGVSSVVMLRSGPAEIRPEIMAELKSREEDGYITLPDEPQGLKAGDAVTIINGPFASFPGLYAGMKGEARVRVLLSILGGQQEVELRRKDIEPSR